MTTGTESKGTEIIAFSKIEEGLAQLRGKYTEVPDCKTKSGYNVVKANLKEYRDLKKKVEDTRKQEKKDLLARGKAIDQVSRDIMLVVDKVFEPHKQAKADEDERLATEKREKEEAIDRREKEIRGCIDAMRDMYLESVSKTAEGVAKTLADLLHIEINDNDFGDFKTEALAVKTALTSKLMDLQQSKKTEEETAEKLKEAEEKLKAQQDQLRIEDQKRQKEADDKAEADRKKMAEENAKLKNDNEKLQADQKKLKDAQEKIKADQQKIEDHKKKAIKEAEDKKAEEIRLKKEVEENKKREERENTEREEAEKEAKKEAVKRREELLNSLETFRKLGQNFDPMIEAIENKEIPYLRINWLEK